MNITREDSTLNYTITRDDGTAVTLAITEVLALRDFLYTESLRADVEYAVAAAVENQQVSFDNFAEVGSEYTDADDARTDFINHVVEGIKEDNVTYDRNPYLSEEQLYDIVIDYARDDGWEVSD